MELQQRANAASKCPTIVGLTMPALLDDRDGRADYLFRGFNFRLCVIDKDGKIAFHSRDEKDYNSETLDRAIKGILQPLLDNGGRVSARAIAAGRCDAAGKPAYGFWLPRAEYFQAVHIRPPNKPEDVLDAHGVIIQVARAKHNELKQKRGNVTRLFVRGETPSTRPVVLVFADQSTLTGAISSAAGMQQRYGKRADVYLVYTSKTADMRVRAREISTALKTVKAPPVCLIDTPENEVTFAYNAAPARIVVIERKQAGGGTVRYVSPVGANGMKKGVAGAEAVLKKLE